MALTTNIIRFNSNVNMPTPSPGDVIHVIYDITVAANPNAYPAGGEPISFANEFNEVHSVVADLALAAPTIGAADVVGGTVPVFQRAAGAPGLNTGFLRFYVGGGAGVNLAELPVAVYPNVLGFTLTVHGRPSTDAQ